MGLRECIILGPILSPTCMVWLGFRRRGQVSKGSHSFVYQACIKCQLCQSWVRESPSSSGFKSRGESQHVSYWLWPKGVLRERNTHDPRSAKDPPTQTRDEKASWAQSYWVGVCQDRMPNSVFQLKITTCALVQREEKHTPLQEL